MPAQFVTVAVLVSIVSFLAGSALAGWRLRRRHREACRALSQEMTQKVKDRYAIYLQLEAQITRVIDEFDRREAEFRTELMSQTRHIGRLNVAVSAASGEPSTAPNAESLDWMDACEETPSSEPEQVEETSSAERLIVEDGSDAEVEVDQWAQRLETLQQEKRAELDLQRRVIEELESRIRNLEPLTQALARREHEVQEWRGRCAALEGGLSLDALGLEDGSSEAAASPVAGVDDLYGRIARSEREIRAWHERYEELAREREASIESARDLAAQLRPYVQRCQDAETAAGDARARAEELTREIAALREESDELAAMSRDRGERLAALEQELAVRGREISALQATIASRESELGRIRASQERLSAENRALTTELDARNARMAELEAESVRQIAELEQGLAARQEEIGQIQDAYQLVVDERRRLSGEIAERDRRFGEVAREAETLRGELAQTGASLDGHKSQIGELMKNLELTQEEAEARRRLLQEQDSHVIAAYSMLEKMRPMMQALELELAARAQAQRQGS
jgi:chromosome segregation ATPase